SQSNHSCFYSYCPLSFLTVFITNNLSCPYVYFYLGPATYLLHSFPTRRSSDLSYRRPRGGRPCRRPSTAPCGSPRWRAPGRRSADRKSTRLNSSHVKISYTVFFV